MGKCSVMLRHVSDRQVAKYTRKLVHSDTNVSHVKAQSMGKCSVMLRHVSDRQVASILESQYALIQMCHKFPTVLQDTHY